MEHARDGIERFPDPEVQGLAQTQAAVADEQEQKMQAGTGDLSGGRACLGFPRLPAKRELFQHFPGKMLLCQSISPPLFAFAMTGFFCQYDEALALTMIFLQ